MIQDTDLLLHFGGNVTVNCNNMASHVDLKGTPAFSDAKPAKEPYTYVCTFFQSINYQVAFFAFK
jgi:hypothetical protein